LKISNSRSTLLKHGRGRSYDSLVQRADRLPFKNKRAGEVFFFEGDVSEVATLVEVDDAFLLNCAEVNCQVTEAIQKARPGFFR
jgi:hypothetical protein